MFYEFIINLYCNNLLESSSFSNSTFQFFLNFLFHWFFKKFLYYYISFLSGTQPYTIMTTILISMTINTI